MGRQVTNFAYPNFCLWGALLSHIPATKLGSQSGARLCSQLRVLGATPRCSAPSLCSLVSSRDMTPPHPQPSILNQLSQQVSNFFPLCIWVKQAPKLLLWLGSSECRLPLRNDPIRGLESGRDVFKLCFCHLLKSTSLGKSHYLSESQFLCLQNGNDNYTYLTRLL